MATLFQSLLQQVERFCREQEGKDASYDGDPRKETEAPHRRELHDLEYNRLIGILQKSMKRRRRNIWYKNMGSRYSPVDHVILQHEFRKLRIDDVRGLDELFVKLGLAIGRSPSGVRWQLSQVLRRDSRTNEELAEAYNKTMTLIKLIKEDQVHNCDLSGHIQKKRS